MSLRSKTILAVTLTIVALVSSLASVVSGVFMGGFRTAELEHVHSHLAHAVHTTGALSRSIARKDWAAWDQAVTFVQDGNAAFVSSNLTEECLAENGLTGIAILQPSGTPVYAALFSATRNQFEPMPEAILRNLQSDMPLLRHTSTHGMVTGILCEGSARFLVASLPISTSRYEGPIRGAMVFLRAIDASLQEELTAETSVAGFNAHLHPLDGEFAPVVAELMRMQDSTAVVRSEGEHLIAGYTLLNDVYGRPALLLRIDADRPIYHQAKRAGIYLLGLVALVAAIFGGASIVLVQRLVLAPLCALKEGVRRITRQPHCSERLSCTRCDELGALAVDINAMLDALEGSLHARRESEERFRGLVETTNDWVWETDANLVFTYVNGRTFDILGYQPEEIIGRAGFDFQTPAEQERVRSIFAPYHKNAQPFELLEVTLLHKNGQPVIIEFGGRPYFDTDGNLLGFRGVGRDVTARRKLSSELEIYQDHLEALVEDRSKELVDAQRMLMQQEKLASVGQLAAGIAHEINTPIQYIGDNLQALSDFVKDLTALIGTYRSSITEAPPDQPLAPDVRAAIQAAEQERDLDFILEDAPNAITQGLEGVQRVAHIVRAMKDFSHTDRDEMAPVDINRAINSTLTVARNEYKYVADVTTELGELPPVECYGSEINQVLLNMFVNAAHAIADTGQRGMITVRTRVIEADQVEIAVGDTGTGIPESARGRIFDPFFTTKEVGKGTGQGLNIAHRVIVERHHGTLSFDTEMGKGTTFHIRLPVRQAVPAPEGEDAQ